jgi:hypothetical protein
MNRYLHRAAPLLAILPFVACDTFSSDNSQFLREQLTRAEQRWDSTGTADYTLVVKRRCDCGLDPRQVALEVVADEIAGAIFTDTGEPLDASELGQYATVRDLFGLARSAVDQRVPIILVEFNQEFGYIDDLVINYDLSRIDDDFLYVVDDYIPTEPSP